MSTKTKKERYPYRTNITLADGTRRDVYGKTKQEFDDKLLELKLKMKRGITPTDMTFAEFSKPWYKLYKEGTDLRENSKKSIRNTVNTHILPFIGNMPISCIMPMHIQVVMNAADKCSNSTSAKVLAALRSIFNVAVDNNLILKSPVSTELKAKGKVTPEKIPLTADECDRILKEVRNPRARIVAFLGLRTGMRRGEIVALHWDDVDFDEHVIHVRHNAVMLDGQPTVITDDLKTTAGERDIGMPADLEDVLLDWKKRARSGKFVLVMKNGKPLTKSAFRSLWRSIARALPHKHFTAHTMRHTYITQLVESGVDIELVQYLAGHADDRMTKKVYLHRDKVRLAQSAAKSARDVFEKQP